jgi:cellulose synthase/poly-beta-1,6-N-acetylglucosamine synthase-like glycosyltransferase
MTLLRRWASSMDVLSNLILNAFLIYVILFFIGVNITYTILLVLSAREILYHMRHNRSTDYRSLVQSELTPPVSILAPAYNEGPTIISSVKSLLKLSYGRYEVVVINDGSTDRTLEELIDKFRMFRCHEVYHPCIASKPVRGMYRSRLPEYKYLLVVDKVNGGKADALNVGINVARYD